jgi:hypothetical protein
MAAVDANAETVRRGLENKCEAMRMFLAEHSMEPLAQQFHDEGYVQPEDVMDMDVETVGELHFLNAAQKAHLLQILEPQHGTRAGTNTGNTAHQMAEESLQRENEQLQEQLYDLKAASGHATRQMEVALSSAQAMQQKAEAENAALKVQMAELYNLEGASGARLQQVDDDKYYKRQMEEALSSARALLQKAEVESAEVKIELANKVTELKAAAGRVVEVETLLQKAEAESAALKNEVATNAAHVKALEATLVQRDKEATAAVAAAAKRVAAAASPERPGATQPAASTPREQEFTITKGVAGFGMRISLAAVVTGYTESGSPAEQAGMPIGGQITEVNGVAVADKPAVVAQLKASADPNTVVFTVTEAMPQSQPNEAIVRVSVALGKIATPAELKLLSTIGISHLKVVSKTLSFYDYEVQFRSSRIGKFIFTDDAGDTYSKSCLSTDGEHEVSYDSAKPRIVLVELCDTTDSVVHGLAKLSQLF